MFVHLIKYYDIFVCTMNRPSVSSSLKTFVRSRKIMNKLLTLLIFTHLYLLGVKLTPTQTLRSEHVNGMVSHHDILTNGVFICRMVAGYVKSRELTSKSPCIHTRQSFISSLKMTHHRVDADFIVILLVQNMHLFCQHNNKKMKMKPSTLRDSVRMLV